MVRRGPHRQQSPKGSVNLFGTGTTAKVSLTGNDLSINFGANGITSLLTETGVTGTGRPTTNFGDGWYALGIDPTGNPGNQQVFWVTVLPVAGIGHRRHHGERALYHRRHGRLHRLPRRRAIGHAAGCGCQRRRGRQQQGPQRDGRWPTATSVGATAPHDASRSSSCSPVPRRCRGTPSRSRRAQVQALLPEAIAAWQAAGLDAADVRKLEGVPVQVGNLGTSILGLEAAGAITINQTAAGNNWYVSAAAARSGIRPGGPGGESSRAREPGGG